MTNATSSAQQQAHETAEKLNKILTQKQTSEAAKGQLREGSLKKNTPFLISRKQRNGDSMLIFLKLNDNFLTISIFFHNYFFFQLWFKMIQGFFWSFSRLLSMIFCFIKNSVKSNFPRFNLLFCFKNKFFGLFFDIR